MLQGMEFNIVYLPGITSREILSSYVEEFIETSLLWKATIGISSTDLGGE